MADVLNLDFPHCGDSTTPNQATYDLSLGAGGEPCFDIVKSSGAVAFYLGSSNAGNMTLNMQKNPTLKLQPHL